MTDDSGPDKSMAVTFHKDGEPDLSIGESAFETAGVEVKNAVPIAELEQLADEWEDTLYTSPGESTVRSNCAQELRALIQEYGDGDE